MDSNGFTSISFVADARKIRKEEIHNAISQVYQAFVERGYNPVNQICGYLLSGDPTYISAHKNARITIQHYEREEILEELVQSYLDGKDYFSNNNT